MQYNRTPFPYPYFNAISLFTSGFLLLWFIWSLMRFIDTIRIRIAVLTNRLIPIRGINHYLMTFNEIVSQAHINSIIHTRQPNPPKSMKSLYLPFSVDSVQVNHGSVVSSSVTVEKRLELKLWVCNPSKVFILYDFRAERLKGLLKTNNTGSGRDIEMGTENNTENRNSNNSPNRRRSTRTPTFAQFSSYLNNLSNSSSYDSIQRFVDYRLCREIYFAGSINNGVESIAAILPRFLSSNPGCRIGVLIVSDPSVSGSHLSAPNSSSGLLKSNNWLRQTDANAAHGHSIDTPNDIEAQALNADFMNPLSTKPVAVRDSNAGVAMTNIHHNEKNQKRFSFTSNNNKNILEGMGFALCVLTGSTICPTTLASASGHRKSSSGQDTLAAIPNAAMNSSFGGEKSNESSPSKYQQSHPHHIRTPLSLSECFIYTKQGHFYSAQEIFGWKGSRAAGKGSNSSESPSRESEDQATSMDEECVVCLTEKKEIALLPCRHLCVCRQCLSHIDKCPVCRTNFDEYVAINSTERSSLQIPFHVKS